MNENHERATDERDDIARLMRAAGKREAVPRDRADRVRAAARAQWQREFRRRSRKRAVWTAAGLAAAAAVVLAVAIRILPVGSGDPTAPEVAIRVEALAGDGWSRSTVAGERPEPRALTVGAEFEAGTELSTAERSRAAFRLASGHSIRLDGSTTIRLLDGGSLALDRGTLYVDSVFETEATGSIDVHTPLGVVEEIGTQFEVRLENDNVRVRLREGAVVVHHESDSHDVRAGTELELAPDGSVVRRAIPVHGAAWEWIAGITPMLELEGRSARTFLDWVARERGWTLAFADEAVARSAGEIRLGGTVAQLTLDEALDAVLPTCGLTHRVENGVLLIAAP